MVMKPPDLAKHIDHTCLDPIKTVYDIQRLCQEGRAFHFAAVCVLPIYVPLCRSLLQDSSVKVCTVIGFPLGGEMAETKSFSTRNVVRHGAQEVDMVMNLGAFKSRDYSLVRKDIRGVVEATMLAGISSNVITKVIIETCYLSPQEISIACQLAQEAGADFVKSSTGLGPYGARVEDILLMRKSVGREMGIKASGGIRSFGDAMKMLDAGANRIGTSSGVAISQEVVP